jgi:tetratricopeptide (TPR) repeat protein
MLAAERARIEDHAAQCSHCRALALALAGLVPHARSTDLGAEGATIGRYRVLGSLGSGAMGVVMRARDPVLDREVAIKMVNSADASATTRARMLSEAQTLARIDHPNVVRVHDAGEVGDEVFLAMALVPGPTLTQWLAEEPRTLAACVEVLRSVAAGVIAVHGVGLVHRDIKPDNIIVHDGAGVLVDFGLARPEVGAAGSGIAGTTRYLAPELTRGARANAASDQFAWWTVVEDVLRHAVIPARARRRVDRVIARGLSADPAQRFASMRDASSALVAAARRPRRVSWLVVPAALALTGGALALTGRQPEADPCNAALPASWLVQRPAVAASLVRAGASAPTVLAELDRRASRYAVLHGEACRAASSPASDDHTRALREQLCVDQAWSATERVIGELQRERSEPVRVAVDRLINVLPLDRCASPTIPAVPAPPPPEHAAEVEKLSAAIGAIRSSDDQNATHRVARLHELEPEVVKLDYAGTTIAWHANLAVELATLGDLDGARRELRAELALAESAGNDEARAHALVDLYTLTDLGGSGDPALRDAAEGATARLGNPGVTAQLKIREATKLTAGGDLAGALAAAREGSRLYDSVAIDAHEQLVDAAGRLALIQQAMGDHQAALASYDRGLQLALRRFSPHTRRPLELRTNRATCLLDLHEFEAARRELLAVVEDAAPASASAAAMTTARDGLCEIDLLLPDLASARQSCPAALALSEQLFGADNPSTYAALVLAGREQLAERDPKAAIPLLERALAIVTRTQTDDLRATAARGYLALALHAAHRDSTRAHKLAHDAAAALQGQSRLSELAAQLAQTFPR